MSYGTASLNPVIRGPVALPHGPPGTAIDAQRVLVELPTEVLGRVHTPADPVLDGATPDPSDDIDRVILVVNDSRALQDWATTGTWSYRVGGDWRYLSVSVHGPADTPEQYAHSFAHQFGLRDLYLHPEVEFPTATLPSGYDVMTRDSGAAHPLVWSKELAGWMPGRSVLYIPRAPRIGAAPIALSYQSTLSSDERGAIAIGLTAGVTNLADEFHFYMVEARSPHRRERRRSAGRRSHPLLRQRQHSAGSSAGVAQRPRFGHPQLGGRVHPEWPARVSPWHRYHGECRRARSGEPVLSGRRRVPAAARHLRSLARGGGSVVDEPRHLDRRPRGWRRRARVQLDAYAGYRTADPWRREPHLRSGSQLRSRVRVRHRGAVPALVAVPDGRRRGPVRSVQERTGS